MHRRLWQTCCRTECRNEKRREDESSDEAVRNEKDERNDSLIYFAKSPQRSITSGQPLWPSKNSNPIFSVSNNLVQLESWSEVFSLPCSVSDRSRSLSRGELLYVSCSPAWPTDELGPLEYYVPLHKTIGFGSRLMFFQWSAYKIRPYEVKRMIMSVPIYTCKGSPSLSR